VRGCTVELTFLCDEALAASWQSHHDNADPRVLHLDAHAVSQSRHIGPIGGVSLLKRTVLRKKKGEEVRNEEEE
jgi:hypothetical protein